MRGVADCPKGVVFDFGGVISVSPMAKWERTLYPYCESVGVARTFVADGFVRYRKLWDGDAITFGELYGRIFADAGRSAPTERELAEIRRLDAASWAETLRADTLAFMRALKATGRRVGILSNMSSDFWRDFFVPRCAEYRALADAEIISGLERVCKPEAEIYRRAEQRLGLEPSELLFLDDFPSNVEAARACGWAGEVVTDGVRFEA